jgi:hypothetical protein
VCDVCKKQIPNAEKDLNYVTYLDKALCIPCKREFEDEVREIMDEEGGELKNTLKYQDYDYRTYKKVFRETLVEMSK